MFFVFMGWVFLKTATSDGDTKEDKRAGWLLSIAVRRFDLWGARLMNSLSTSGAWSDALPANREQKNFDGAA
jgi:hypothetical protein